MYIEETQVSTGVVCFLVLQNITGEICYIVGIYGKIPDKSVIKKVSLII